MHRNVDLHYQYLTSSYACMLSCPISLRPFVILEGTGLRAPRSPGTKARRRDVLCRAAPMKTGVICLAHRSYSEKGEKKRHRQHMFRGWWVWCKNVGRGGKKKKRKKNSMSGGCCSVVRDEKYLFQKEPPPIQVHNHLFLRSVKLAANQHLVFIYTELRLECQCVGIRSFSVSL